MEDQPRIDKCNTEEELQLWYQRLAHMPFKIIQHMSNIGHLSKKFSRIQQPKCHACMLGKATKVPWK
jgi:hypothetical protein